MMLTPEKEARKAELLQELKEIEDGARARSVELAQERKYSFADVRSPEDLEVIQRFQRVFGRYAPWLLESEHATIRVHGAFQDGLKFNPPETINKTTFEADLKRFRKAIRTLADWPIWCMKPMLIRRPPEIDDPEDVTNVASGIHDFLLTLSDAAHYYENLPQILDELEGWARQAARYVPDRRNINWEAVHAVDRLRGYWENMTEIPAPKRAVNPASLFASYLRDAFEFFEITGDPIAAFKRWVALERSEPHTWK